MENNSSRAKSHLILFRARYQKNVGRKQEKIEGSHTPNVQIEVATLAMGTDPCLGGLDLMILTKIGTVIKDQKFLYVTTERLMAEHKGLERGNFNKPNHMEVALKQMLNHRKKQNNKKRLQ